jgi:hypothetical protein
VHRSAAEQGDICEQEGGQICAPACAPRLDGDAFSSSIVLPDGGQLRDLADACDLLRGLSPVQRAAVAGDLERSASGL